MSFRRLDTHQSCALVALPRLLLASCHGLVVVSQSL